MRGLRVLGPKAFAQSSFLGPKASAWSSVLVFGPRSKGLCSWFAHTFFLGVVVPERFPFLEVCMAHCVQRLSQLFMNSNGKLAR